MVIYGGTRRPVQSSLYWITPEINWDMGMGVGRGGCSNQGFGSVFI
jgi:hypothetical protein